MPHEAINSQYLGDGVYVAFDGYHIWLQTQEGNKIALEPVVLEQLDKYRRALDAAYNIKQYSPKEISP